MLHDVTNSWVFQALYTDFLDKCTIKNVSSDNTDDIPMTSSDTFLKLFNECRRAAGENQSISFFNLEKSDMKEIM